jgi:glycosyltransferase involved in cell wall biosynthesis
MHGITNRMRVAAGRWLNPKEVTIPVRRADLLAADLSKPFRFRVPKLTSGDSVVLNWVTIPASPGSGGHTTLFRVIRYLQAHGYTNRVYFYNVYGGDLSYYESIARQYYGFDGKVGSVDVGMEDAHGVVATSWPTAYPVFNSHCTGKRFYFVQDFEPYFYPVGAMSLLAENTYRMGFHGITVGSCFADKLKTEFNMAVDSFEYGCDTSRYHRLQNSKRSGVVFYARRETARRGFELGLMALEVFAARCPNIEIHIYGDEMGNLPFTFVDHGRVTPDKLNELYNSCYAGLTLSFTNVSLVALEMLSAGCIPVVNDSVLVRTDLKSSFVQYAMPYPLALALALEKVVLTQDFDSLSRGAAASVRGSSWDDVGATVDAIFRRALEVSPQTVPDSAGIPTADSTSQ